MPEPSTFSINRLNDSIFPLTYSVKTKYDINVLYFTVASVEDVYKLIRDRANAYLYIFDVGHYMEKDGIYLTLKEILENSRIEADHIYEDDIIAIKKEKFGKFLKFPQYDFRMFDYDRLMNDDEFAGFFRPATERLKDLDVFMDIKNNLPKYFINCHDNSLLYCETRDMDLKSELLKTMMHDYFEAYLNKNHKTNPAISLPQKEFVDDLFGRWDKIIMRETGTSMNNKSINAVIYDAENKEAGTVTYKIDKQEWIIKV